MPITYDIETDYLYNKGIQKGIVQGHEKGMLFALRISTLSNQEIAKEFEVPVAFVQQVREKHQL